MQTLVLGAVFGAALTLVVQLIVQLYVVPRVEARKRREDRWERNVLDLMELLKTSLSDRASDARAAQGTSEDLRQLEREPGQDPDKIAKFRAKHAFQTRKATRAFTDLARTRVGLLLDHVVSLSPRADEIAQLQIISRRYWMRVAMVSSWDETHTGEAVDGRWEMEYEARVELSRQLRLLADLPHPPRLTLSRRCWRRSAYRLRRAVSRARTVPRRPATDQTL